MASMHDGDVLDLSSLYFQDMDRALESRVGVLGGGQLGSEATLLLPIFPLRRIRDTSSRALWIAYPCYNDFMLCTVSRPHDGLRGGPPWNPPGSSRPFG